jgi:hypothetical protein
MAINTSIVKSYAPQARREFIAAVKTRAARFGIIDGGSATIQEQGEVAIINGQAYPRTVARQCRDLQGKIRLRGFDAVMEEVAYTWFNRFAAIRYMELHGYLDHGFRVLSHPAGEITPEIVQHAEKVDLPGLKADRVVELKLDGRRDEELYRLLLVAQCNALHAAMPFLFERINDETELLLPDNLLHSDSVIRQMVAGVPEEDWQEIEIIGWLYQFYISEKKDQVIGKVVKSEDIPAATQLFTPNWIVRYMVQNSLGAKWLATYPDSPIKAKMEYYIEPAEQPEEVRRQIEAETPQSLDPEKLTFLDPASGSGHILVEAYDLFKEIYLERGYRLRDIPRLILEKNLHGLDIDDRAAQLSGFALMMRARADDRRITSSTDPVRLNVLVVRDANDYKKQIQAGNWSTSSASTVASDQQSIIGALAGIFRDAKTAGSLIRLPADLIVQCITLHDSLQKPQDTSGDLLAGYEAALAAEQLIRQAIALGRQYDIVAANPPYMGAKGMNERLKSFAHSYYPASKSDLFAMFMERSIAFCAPDGRMAMINMQSWMFLSSFEALRAAIFAQSTVQSMTHLGARAFDTIGGEVVSTTAFVLRKGARSQEVGRYFRLVDGESEAQKASLLLKTLREGAPDRSFYASGDDFSQIPGAPVAYWISSKVRNLFSAEVPLGEVVDARQGLATADNGRFLRFWWEVDRQRSAYDADSENAVFALKRKWVAYNKGGPFRRWYGNHEYVVNWSERAAELRAFQPRSVIRNPDYYFRRSVSWSDISTDANAFRYYPPGFVFDSTGHSMFQSTQYSESSMLCFGNSAVAKMLVNIINPTIHLHVGYLKSLPALRYEAADQERISNRCVEIAREDWNSSELSWDFTVNPLLSKFGSSTVSSSYKSACEYWDVISSEAQALESENNQLMVQKYNLHDEVDADVNRADVSLFRNPAFQYIGYDAMACEEQRLTDTVKELISYYVACLVGRFSIDVPGLILGNQGNDIQEFLSVVKNPTFMPDADNIIPMLDDNWFEDDVADRFFEYLRIAFGTEHFDENLAFIEKAVGRDIRKYFKRDFFNDHLKRYKRRPIYWVFSSGKEKAFEAIVYMHRYNETTLARMRMNYVVPLQSQMANRIERLATELSGPNLSSAERKRKDTQRAKLIKQLEELGRFEEELRHLADQRIRIDLDDGVKVNYGKFGNLLAEVKAVTGGADD